MIEELFIKASRKALRFESTKGNLTTEDLWELSLTSLDTIAKTVNRKLKDSTEESFITIKSTSSNDLQTKLDILKYVIQVKMAELEASKLRGEKAAMKAQLQEMLLNKKMQEMAQLTAEEIQKKIDELG